MPAFNRSTVVIIGLSLVLLLSLGLWVYSFYFSSTRYALQRAEELFFRRMAVAQVDEAGIYRFFFVSNRQPLEGAKTWEGRFGSERQETLSFGAFKVKIEPSLGLGMIINPTQWFQNREILIKEVTPLESSALLQQVADLVEETPGRPLLVVVHGFREAFESALRKTAFLGHVLDVNTPILLFDWPGNQGSSMRGYRRASEVARASGLELAKTLELLIREVGPDRLSLIANSMGAQVVVEAFGHLHAQEDLWQDGPPIEHLLLSAPDVDYSEFNETFRRFLADLTRNSTVYVSSNDRALLASRLLNGGRRLGESSLNPRQIPGTLPVVDYFPAPGEVTVVDVTPVNRTRNFHNFSLETPEFYDDIFLRLANPQTPRSRLRYPVQTPNGTIYWVLTRGR